MDSKVRWVFPKVSLHNSDFSVNMGMENVWQVEQIFEPYRIISKELNRKRQQVPSKYFRKVNDKNTKSLFL